MLRKTGKTDLVLHNSIHTCANIKTKTHDIFALFCALPLNQKSKQITLTLQLTDVPDMPLSVREPTDRLYSVTI
jgi:hypothetical protein